MRSQSGSAWLRRAGRRTACVCLLLLTIAPVPALAQQCPQGTWTFVADSDGATADTGTMVTLTFSGPGVAFAAVAPGRTLTDRGSCSATRDRITLTLPTLGKSVAGAPFTLAGTALTLPLKVFSSGPGTSSWIQATVGGSNQDAGGSGSDSAGGSGSSGGSAPPGGAGAGVDSSADPSPSPPPHPIGGAPQAGNTPSPDTPYASFVGDWAGSGWSYETRFRQSRTQFVSQLTPGVSDPLISREGIDGTVMELVVQQKSHFAFTIDASGHVTGQGGIVYNLTPNLCGLSVLVKQANESINFAAKLPSIYKFANKLGTAAIKGFVAQMEGDSQEAAASVFDLAKQIGTAVGKAKAKALLAQLNEQAKARFEQLNLIEKHEELSCSQVGPATLDQLTSEMESQFAKAALGSAVKVAMSGPSGLLAVPQALMLSIPGVTQVTYSYRGLVDGPNKSPQATRLFTIDGHLDVSGGTPKLYLTMSDLTGGPSQLTIEYMVNFKTDRGHFPAFSPFLDEGADVHLPGSAAAGTSPPPQSNEPFAAFSAAGTHRNGTAAWQEYRYEWSAHRVTEPHTEQTR